MKLTLPLTRLLGAAILLAAFCAAPSIANAHAGHAVPAAPMDTSATAMGIQEIVEAHVNTASELRTGSSAMIVCGGLLCCGNAPCAACGFVIVGETSIGVPLSAGSLLRLPVMAAGSGIDPLDISRPPRSFV